MPIGYHPGVVDQSGQIVAQGMHNRNQQLMELAEMLVGMGQKKQDKLDQGVKARSALKTLGVPNADHMSAAEALGAASVIPEIVAKQKADKIDKSQAGFLSSFTGALKGGQPEVDPAKGAAATNLFPGNPMMAGPMMAATGAITPGAPADPRTAIVSALQQNPGAMNTDAGREAFSRLMATTVTPQRQMPTVIPNAGGTGANVLFDPTTGRATQLRPPTSATGGQKNLPPTLDEDEQWEQQKTAGGKPIPGLYHSVKAGKRTGKQWYDPQNAPRTGNLFEDAATPAPADETPAPKTAQGGYEIGVKYSGLTYNGGDPLDEANWTK